MSKMTPIPARVHRPRVTAVGTLAGGAALALAFWGIQSLELRSTAAIGVAWTGLLVFGAIPIIYFIGNARSVVEVRVHKDGLRIVGSVYGEPSGRLWSWKDVDVHYQSHQVTEAGGTDPSFILRHRQRGRLVVTPTTPEALAQMTVLLRELGIQWSR